MSLPTWQIQSLAKLIVGDSFILFSDHSQNHWFPYVWNKSDVKQETGKTLPTGVSVLSEKRKICLRDPVQEPLKNSMLLELSIEGQHKISNCLLGQLEMRTHLCLRHKISKLAQSHYGLPYCSRFKTDFGEDRLIWTSNLTTQLLSQSGGYVLIFLPW